MAKRGHLLCHVRLDVPPALSDLAEDGRVAAYDGDARHQESEQHQELLRGLIVLPEKNRFTYQVISVLLQGFSGLAIANLNTKLDKNS